LSVRTITPRELADAAFAHSTMAEGLSPLFSQVPHRAMEPTTLKTA
jgi:hypothetical protein